MFNAVEYLRLVDNFFMEEKATTLHVMFVEARELLSGVVFRGESELSALTRAPDDRWNLKRCGLVRAIFRLRQTLGICFKFQWAPTAC